MIRRVHEQAPLERQAPASNAIGEIFTKAKELVDLDIEAVTPQRRECFPVVFSRSSLFWKAFECLSDLGQGDADALSGTNERDASEYVAAIAPLICFVSSGKNEAFSFVEMQSGN